MSAVLCDVNVDTYIRSLLPRKEPSFGLIIGYRERDANVSVAHALRFKDAAATNLASAINQTRDVFIAGFGIVGIFVVSQEDQKDVARRLSLVVNSSILPRPMLVVHLYTKSSKFTAKDVYSDGEERIRPVEWKEVRDMHSSPLLLSSSISFDNFVHLPKSISWRKVAESLPQPTHVVFSHMSFSGREGDQTAVLPLGAILCQAADADGMIGNQVEEELDHELDQDVRTDTVSTLAIGVGYSLATTRTGFSQNRIALASSKGDVFLRVTGGVPLVVACRYGDSAARVVQAIGQATVSSVALLLDNLSLPTGSSGSIVDLPTDMEILTISSHEGQSVPVLVVGRAHPNSDNWRRRLWDVFELQQPSADAALLKALVVPASPGERASSQGEQSCTGSRLYVTRIGECADRRADAPSSMAVEKIEVTSAEPAEQGHGAKASSSKDKSSPSQVVSGEVISKAQADDDEEDYEDEDEDDARDGSADVRASTARDGDGEVSKARTKKNFMFVLIVFGILLIFLAIAVKVALN